MGAGAGNDPLPPEGAGRPDPEAFGRGLGPGLGVNLLVRDVARAARFQAQVLGATVDYWERDFAVLRVPGALWMLHSDASYRAHPLAALLAAPGARGVGVELRLYGCDPDRAAAAAPACGGEVLAPPADKPHGVREAHIRDPEGYVWVPTVPKP